MPFPHGLRRGRRLGLGGEFGPSLAHMGGVKGCPLGVGVGAGLKGEKLGGGGLVLRQSEGDGQHHGIGGVVSDASPGSRGIPLGRGPEPSRSGV